MRYVDSFSGKLIDYSRLNSYCVRHHKRYERYVDQCGLLCQECGGSGQVYEETIGYWDRYEPCCWCEGTGKVTRHIRGQWLTYKKELKRLRDMNNEREKHAKAMR